MKHKTLFRLALKLIGTWIAWTATVSALWQLGELVRQHLLVPSNQIRTWEYGDWRLTVCYYLPMNGIQLAVGLYLFFGGKWIADLAIPSNRPYCPECGYDVKGVAGTRCPECDTVFRTAPTVTGVPTQSPPSP